MNKKLIIGISSAVVALAIVVALIVAISTGLFSGKKADNNSSNTSSTVSVDDGKNASTQSGTASSSDEVVNKGEVGIGKVSGKTGDAISVPIKLSENPGIFAGQFYFEYDATVLSYEGYDEGDILDEYTVEPSEGCVNCIINGSDVSRNYSDNGNLIVLNFKVKDGAAPGEYKIKLSDKSMICNIDEQIVTPKIGEGSVTVK